MKAGGKSTALMAVAITVLLMMATDVWSAPPQFDLPVDCKIGDTCFIQHYVDMKPGKGAEDYQCGSLTYNGHKGTDIRLRTLTEMERGAAVLAAADGIVTKLRDGIPDQYFEDYPDDQMEAIRKTGLGNTVIISHDGGWKTVYAHMRNGSIVVSEGDKIKKGAVLGQIGMSGLTSFPHLHFQVMSGKRAIDPFSGPQKSTPCTHTETSLWSDESLAALVYEPTSFMVSGFSGEIPQSRRDIESGNMAQKNISADSDLLVFWSLYSGSHKEDIVEMEILGPEGHQLKKIKLKPARKNQISRYNYAGIRRPENGWKRGRYTGEITIKRGDAIYTDTAEVAVR
jgi:hypothetical protein